MNQLFFTVQECINVEQLFDCVSCLFPRAKRRKKSKLDTLLAALATQLQDGEKRLVDEFRRDERATRQWNEELLARSQEIENRRLEKQAEREQQREKLSHENEIGLVTSIMSGFTNIARRCVITLHDQTLRDETLHDKTLGNKILLNKTFRNLSHIQLCLQKSLHTILSLGSS